jgi:hypothetical protein
MSDHASLGQAMRRRLAVGDYVERLLGRQDDPQGTVARIIAVEPQIVEVAWDSKDFGVVMTEEAAERLIRIPQSLVRRRPEARGESHGRPSRCSYCKQAVDDRAPCRACAVRVARVEDRMCWGALPLSPLTSERPFDLETTRTTATVCDGCGDTIAETQAFYTCQVDRRLLKMHTICTEIWLRSPSHRDTQR